MICFCLFKTRPTAPRVEMGRRIEVGAEGPGLLSLKHVIPACPDYPGFTPPTSGPRGLAAQQPGQSPLYLWLLGSGTRASSERSGDRQQARVGRVRSLAEPLPSSWLGFSQA